MCSIHRVHAGGGGGADRWRAVVLGGLPGASSTVATTPRCARETEKGGGERLGRRPRVGKLCGWGEGVAAVCSGRRGMRAPRGHLVVVVLEHVEPGGLRQETAAARTAHAIHGLPPHCGGGSGGLLLPGTIWARSGRWMGEAGPAAAGTCRRRPRPAAGTQARCRRRAVRSASRTPLGCGQQRRPGVGSDAAAGINTYGMARRGCMLNPGGGLGEDVHVCVCVHRG